MSADASLIRPDFVIIGAMKSATSSLQEQLSGLPGLFMTTPKEPNFFSNEEIYSKGLEWYSSLYESAQPSDIKGEASTHYTKLPKYPDTVNRLKKYCPDTKLIYVMRHPIDRLVSHFAHNWSMGFVSRDTNINDWVQDYQPATTYSLYRMQLDGWFAEFDQDAILPVFFDRLMKEPQLEFERICAFIGYVGDVKWRNELEASNVSSQRIRRIPVFSDLNDSQFVSWARRNFVPQAFRDAVKKRMQLKKRPQLGEDRVRELEKTFDEDLARLGELFGVSLSCNNFKEVTAAQSLDWCLR